MADWRKIEMAIEDFFRRQGAAASRAGGDLVIASVHVDVSVSHRMGGDRTVMSSDRDATPKFITLTELAQELADLD